MDQYCNRCRECKWFDPPYDHCCLSGSARVDDGDGIREVHCKTLEGLWTGLRNFLRPFRGVHKKFLATYTAIFEWAHNFKQITPGFLINLVKYTVKPT